MNHTDLLAKIDPIYIENLANSDHFSVFHVEDDYQILITRGFSFAEDELTFHSEGFLISNKKEIYKFNNNQLDSDPIGLDKIHELLSPLYARNQHIVDIFITEIDKLEDSLYERNTSRIFMDNWFDLKKDLSRIERYYSRNHQVLQSVYKFYANEEIFQNPPFQDLMQEVGYVLHNVGTQAQRLEALHSYYSSLKNDKLNNNLYALTVLSAVFLPLNLVVGFFGMNTENLFFKDNPSGTQYVLAILVGTFLLSFIGVPLVKLMDRYFLRFILGKSHIYKKVSTKIDKIEDILNMEN